jgi:predicted ester cyclase
LALDGYVDHEEALPGQAPGREGVGFFVNVMRTAFPDIRVKAITATVASGDMEAAHVILAGTHSGEMAGVAATGNGVEFGCTDIIRVEDGKVAEHWGTTDTLKLMQQIGAVPR